MDQIFTLRQILEKTKEYNIELHHLFIDFSSAYDTIDRSQLYTAMKEFDIPRKLINMVQITMNNSHCQVRIQTDLSEPLKTLNGLRQGDSLSCLLFNLALEKIVRDAGIQTRGTIFYKSTQILAYADDIDIISRSENDLKKTFLALQNSAVKMGLNINEEKTKYMITNENSRQRKTEQHIKIYNHIFEKVNNFTYLGVIVNRHNNIQEEINKRILNSNKCYFAMIHLFKSKYLTRTTKVRLYKTLIKPVLTYGSETWVLTEHDKSRLAVFERKILRKVYGPVKENGEWRLRYNREIYELYNSPDIVTDIKIGRLRWAGHIQRMKTSEMVRKIMETKPEGRRKAGRPNLRWMDGILQDVKSLRLKNWWMVARDREAWRRMLREALTHPGLLSR